MTVFKIKETEDVRTSFIYEVEADSKEEALELYNNELAGSLDMLDTYVDDNAKLGAIVID